LTAGPPSVSAQGTQRDGHNVCDRHEERWANAAAAASVVSGTSWQVLGLNYEQRYTWRVRATASYLGADGKPVDTFGPWSAFGSFITPQNKGYIRGNELYDPLFNGETIGTIVGPTHFVPGVGISLDSLGSYVSYQLQTPLIEGEFSMLAQNVRTRTEGGKTKLMAEKLSVVMARRHLRMCNVALLVLDASEGMLALDATIAGYAHEEGRAIVLCVNKWDAAKGSIAQIKDWTTFDVR
jgi:hypothetical protein